MADGLANRWQSLPPATLLFETTMPASKATSHVCMSAHAATCDLMNFDDLQGGEFAHKGTHDTVYRHVPLIVLTLTFCQCAPMYIHIYIDDS